MTSSPTFLTKALAGYSTTRSDRPHVTLTFAQSTDAKIAGVGGKQLILSGQESMVMTHWMRTMHDAIMVGIGTALNDDPQLNTRHLPTRTAPYDVPRPVILDSNLRLSPDCKLLRNYRAGHGRRPWIISTPTYENDDSGTYDNERNRYDNERNTRKAALEQAGAVILHSARSSVEAILDLLHERGVRSVMVEGGASVIRSFLAAEKVGNAIDTLIVTVAPVLVGENGVGYGGSYQIPDLEHISTEIFGQDTVFAFRTGGKSP